MGPSKRNVATILVLSLSVLVDAVADVDPGYDVSSAAQVMVNLAGQSWEWGTTAEALLELYNPELSVFGSDPFPGGTVPSPAAGTFALEYAQSYIDIDGQVLVAQDSAVGDPASLGVSAILIGQSNSAYLDAANRQADYILNDAPRWSNGAISQRPDVAELWADNMAMSFPFLAYLAVQTNNVSLMDLTVTQCGLQRDVLQASGAQSWQHIIGPQSQDTGLWSTGNGWAGYGMVRVLHTLQKWSGSSSMTSQATQLKGWIQEILDGAMSSSTDNGLLRNYLNEDTWFGEISGTSLLSAVAYRMAVNDPSMFGQQYVTWADDNRQTLAKLQGSGGIFAPAVDPYAWQDTTPYTSGSPEGQAFTIYLYTAYRDCVAAGICSAPASSITTISMTGLGPVETLMQLSAPITYIAMPAPTSVTCGSPQSCDANGCNGAFNGLAVDPVCTSGSLQGCTCIATDNTCGAPQSCDLNGCAGAFNGLTSNPQCTGNFVGCVCTPTDNTCGAPQSCDLNGCAGAFNGLTTNPQCTGNFVGCECAATSNTCGAPQSCDLNGCAGAFNGLTADPQCTGNFVGCECTPTDNTCGAPQSCDLNGCAGAFNGLTSNPQCTGNFVGCECAATSNTCGAPQSCDLNGCAGAFDGSTPYAQCTSNFIGCDCTATANTCGEEQSCDLNGCAGAFNSATPYPQCTGNFIGCGCFATQNTCGGQQSCDLNGCAGAFNGQVPYAQCTGNFLGCECAATSNTCGEPQSCDLNNCQGQFDLSTGVAYCTENFVGCECTPTTNTCGAPQSCDLNNCDGAFEGNVAYPVCTNFFKGCQCTATTNTCGSPQSCGLNNCGGAFDTSNGIAYCTENFVGCECVANPGTCGAPQSCDLDNCDGAFLGSFPTPSCTNFFAGCQCTPTSNTCGSPQSCNLNGCNGAFDSSGVAVCQGNFIGCECVATSTTCGTPQDCDLNGCNGAFTTTQGPPTCQGNFAGCVCNAVSSTCGEQQSCSANGCDGGFDPEGNAVCMNAYFGCPCTPDAIWVPAPTGLSPVPPPTPTTPSLPPLEDPWYCVGMYEEDDCEEVGEGSGNCYRWYGFASMNMNSGVRDTTPITGVGAIPPSQLCGTTINGAEVLCYGDITAQCAGYGTALFNSRSCRTYCPSMGDSAFCYEANGGPGSSEYISTVLLCDRAMS